MKKICILLIFCLLVSVAQAGVIDDFEDGNMDEYVQTVVLDLGGEPGQIVWSASAGTVHATIATYDGIEQSLCLRDDYGLNIGEILKIDTTGHIDGNQDLGIAVAATKNQTYNVRQDYVSVYMRSATVVYARGFDGLTEFPLWGGDAIGVIDALLIERIAADQFTVGYISGVTRVDLGTRTVGNTDIGLAIGMYTDMRAANTHGGLDNLEIVPEPATIALLGLGGLLLRRKRN